ncbi:MAG: RluA family pseudouridine synthase [Planctomycetes bacterium]|nr:RluA family pseudouridine synthase [Planctomycetota bacterium]MBL7007676.1 RluA family pseudouridine synthase [Planctomycetota bacterium]
MKPLLLDNHLLAVAKPAGIPVQEDASGDESLQQQWQGWLKRELDKPGKVFLAIVHRLDRPVSGVTLFARTTKAASRLSDAWRRGDVQKTYWAVGELAPTAPSLPGFGVREEWLLKDRDRNQVRVVPPDTPGARFARTRWRILGRDGRRVAFELEPLTGRSHQLRLACAGLGAPLLGDLKYGAPVPLPDRSIALHARALDFPHPTLDERIQVLAPAPSHFPSSFFPI